MDSSARLLDSSARDRFAHQTQKNPSMALSGSFSSGHSYYTVESLEGASSLPLLNAPAMLLAEADRESLLRRDVFGRPSADGLASLEAPSRFDGIFTPDARARHPFDELQGFDPRTRALGVDRRSQDAAFRLGMDDRGRSFTPSGGFSQGSMDQRLDMIRARELAAGRSSFPPSTDYQPGQRDYDRRSQDAFGLGMDDRARSFTPSGGFLQGSMDQRSDVIRARELAAGTSSFPPSTDYQPGRRDVDRRSEDAFGLGMEDRARSFTPSGRFSQGSMDQRSDLIRARELAAGRSSFPPSADYQPGRRDVDRRSQDAFGPGMEDRARSFMPSGGFSQGSMDQRSDMIRARELAAGRSSFPPSTDYQPGRRDIDRSSQDAFGPGMEDRARSFMPSGGFSQASIDQRYDMIRARELAAERSSFPPSADYQPGRRDIEDVRSPALPGYSSFRRRDSQNRAGASFSGSARSIHARKEEPPAPRPAPLEATRNQGKGTSSSKTLPSKTESPPEEPKGWCAVCKINCRSLRTHVLGKKHKAMVEGKLVKLKEPSDEGKSITVATSQAEKKRASDAKPEALPGAKRLKALDAAVENGPLVEAAASTMGTADEAKWKRRWLTCELCNVTTTGQFNLNAHLKGRRHLNAARVKEQASSQVAK